LGIVTAALTAFYAFRLLFVAFYGKARMDKRTEAQVHESPWIMLVPMAMLAVLSLFGGYIGLPAFLKLGNAIDGFLSPVFASSNLAHPAGEELTTELSLMGLAVLAAAVGAFAAYWIYIRRWGLAARMTKSAEGLYRVVFNGYYVDEAYSEAIVKPLRMLARVLADGVEVRGIDGAVKGLAWLVDAAGEWLRRLQTGLVRNYALVMLVGVVAVLAYFIIRALVGW
jgi:NADH-quinone oxidoreductase subunit L